MTGRRLAQDGSAATELVLVTPVLVVLLLFVVALGRLSAAQGDVESAARDAARAASTARTAAAAHDAGLEAAAAQLADRGISCSQLTVWVDTSAFRADGFVNSSVSCTVDLGDLSGVGLPGSRTLTAAFTAPIDRYVGVES